MKDKITIAVDARPLSRGTGGIQNYLRCILSAISSDNQYQLILYSDQKIPQEALRQINSIKIRYIKTQYAAPMAWHIAVCLWCFADRPNLFWSPRHHLPWITPKSTKTIVTIHDLVWKTLPSSMKTKNRLIEQFFMPRSVNKAGAIICVSDTTRKLLISHFPETSDRIHVIKHGCDYTKTVIQSIRSSDRDFFLSVGTIEPRKNYSVLLEAFSLYAQNGGGKNLRIVGKQGWLNSSFSDCVENSAYRHRIRVLDNLNDHELHLEYERAHGYVSTSLEEGFGMPVAEAKFFKLPLLLSNIPIFKELFPDADLWLDPKSSADVANKLLKLQSIHSPKLHNENKSLGMDHTWGKCMLLHLELFQNQSPS